MKTPFNIAAAVAAIVIRAQEKWRDTRRELYPLQRPARSGVDAACGMTDFMIGDPLARSPEHTMPCLNTLINSPCVPMQPAPNLSVGAVRWQRHVGLPEAADKGRTSTPRYQKALHWLIRGATSMVLTGVSVAAMSAPLVLNVQDPNKFGVAGSSETFLGSITNETGVDVLASELFLDFSGFDPTLISLAQILGDADFVIKAGSTSAVVPLFDFSLGSGASPGTTYFSDVVVEDSSNNLSDVVTVSISTVPEPGSWAMLVAGLCSIGWQSLRVRRAGRGIAASYALLLTGAPFLWANSAAAAPASPVQIVTGEPGVATESSNLLLVALPLQNAGAAPAQQVKVTSATLVHSTLLSPGIPIALGAMAPDDGAIVNVQFDRSALVPRSAYRMTVSGTYQVAGATYGFTVNRNVTVPPAIPGSAVLKSGTTISNAIDPGHYPVPANLPQPVEQEGNNPIGILVPVGLQRTVFPVTSGPSGEQPPGPGSAAGGVLFGKNTPFGKNGGTPVDPSGSTATTANAANIVLNTGNTYASISTDGGATFTNVNPFCMFGFDKCDAAGNITGSPLIDGDLCCDQVVQYVPSINRFIWLLQSWPTGNVRGATPKTTTPGNNRLRLIIVSPDDVRSWAVGGGSSWLTLDLTAGLLNLGANGWMDYPDLSVGDNFLYVSVDRLGTGNGLVVSRIALNQLTTAGTVTVEFTDPANGGNAHGSHITQNSGSTVFWAGHNGTGKLTVFDLPDTTTTYSWRDVAITPYVNTTASYTSATPTGTNWLGGANPTPPNKGFALEEVIGATRVPISPGLCDPSGPCPPPPADELWFAWGAGLNVASGRPQPYVEVVHIDSGDFRKKQQMHIWNSAFAFAYPAFARNARNDVGVSLGVGGGDREAHTSVGFMGDFQVWALSNSDSSIARYGDFSNVRRAGISGDIFSAVGYGIVKTAFDPHFVLFGRPCDIDVTTCPPPPR